MQPFPLYIASTIVTVLTRISSPSPASASVASVYAEFKAVPVSLKTRFYLPAGTKPSVLAFTSNPPLVDTDVVLLKKKPFWFRCPKCPSIPVWKSYKCSNV